MKILLINPPWIIFRKNNIWNGVSSVMPPLGLAWMASNLEKQGFNVSILDAHAERLDAQGILSRMREMGKFDMVGITSTTNLINNALTIARAVKSEYKEAKVVMGGVHPTIMPAEVLSEEAVDVVVRGEGENTILDLAAGLPYDKIPGISYRYEGAVVHNPERELIADLNSLGFPAYHLLPMHLYYPAVGAYKRLPAVSVLATRGCPGRCTFCYRIFGSRLRVRSGTLVADEVKYLQDRYGIKEISFYDDTFTAVKKQVRAFCNRIKELNVDITWSCFSRSDTVSEEMFRLMKSCGLHQVMFGVESANEHILKSLNKKADLEKVENAVRVAKKVGIDVRTAFMVGNPGETEKSLKETLNFAIKLNPEIAIFNITTPFPGTELYKWAEDNNLLRSKDWDDYDLSNPVMELPTISARQIEAYYKIMYRKFFLRPRYLTTRLKKIRSITDIKNAVKAFKAVIST